MFIDKYKRKRIEQMHLYLRIDTKVLFIILETKVYSMCRKIEES